MKILILPSEAAAVRRACEELIQQVSRCPESVLGLATGGTMLALYRDLASAAQREDLSFKDVSTFNLDEYVGLRPEHPASYHHYMNESLFSLLDFDATRTHLPRGDAEDPHEEAIRFEQLIQNAGGIDLQLLGIGENGHIGFNEPSSSLASRTRVKTLTKGTLNANQRFFKAGQTPPKLAITMGVGTILESAHCLLLATGSKKADAVAGMVEGPLTAACPASALQMHPKVTVILDDAAAKHLKMREYYEHVHPAHDMGD